MTRDKTYHPTSFALTLLAVAEDLVRAAEETREALHECAIEPRARAMLRQVVHRLDIQAKALRDISAKIPGSHGPSEAITELARAWGLTADGDEDGPSFDDPVTGR